MCKMKEVTKSDVKLIAQVLKTATAMALQLFRIKEDFSTGDEKERNFGGIKFHALSHHFAEQIVMFGTCTYTDTDQFERQHNVDGVSAYSRTSKRGDTMSKEMLIRSMTNSFLSILKPRADAETLSVMRSKRSHEEYSKLIPLLTAEGAKNNDIALEDGFRVISNYKSVSVRYDSSDDSLLIEKPIFHNMLTSEQVKYAFECCVEDSKSWSLKHSLRKLQKGNVILMSAYRHLNVILMST